MGKRGAAPWINVILVVVVALIGLHAVFVVFGGNPRNGIVGFVNAVSRLLLLPFTGMFEDQSRLITCAIAALAYCVLAGIALAVNTRLVAHAAAGDAHAGTDERDVGTTRRT